MAEAHVQGYLGVACAPSQCPPRERFLVEALATEGCLALQVVGRRPSRVLAAKAVEELSADDLVVALSAGGLEVGLVEH